MTFDEWLGDRIDYIDPVQYAAEYAAWNYQQQRIDELEKQLQKVEQAGFYWMNKAQEQE